jgi:hypothetical protein
MGDNPGDEVSAYDVETLTAEDTLPFEVYFSLAAGSPTLAALGASPGDILAVGGVFGATPTVFVSSALMGMPPNADMDALSLEVSAGPIVIYAEYSVTSATTGFTVDGGVVVDSGADIVAWEPAVAVFVTHESADLGLRVEDDIDALESVFVEDDCPCDINEDGVINQGDLGALLAAWETCDGDADYNPRADLTGDACVDQADLGYFLANCWGTSC